MRINRIDGYNQYLYQQNKIKEISKEMGTKKKKKDFVRGEGRKEKSKEKKAFDIILEREISKLNLI